MKYPNMIEQEKFLLKQVRKARKTIYGKKYNFSEITSIEDFQDQVPIVSYKEFKPRIQYMLRGEKNITRKGKIPRFAISS